MVESAKCRPFTFQRLYDTAAFNFGDYPDRLAWPTPIANEIINTGAFCDFDFGKLPPELENFVSDPASKGLNYLFL